MRLADSDATEAALDRALMARAPDAPAFSVTAQRLRAAHTTHDIVRAAQDLLGTPTVLINNAGLNISGSVRKLTPAQWNRVIGVNLSGAFYCTHAALPGMYEAGWGRVVLFGSPAGGRADRRHPDHRGP